MSYPYFEERKTANLRWLTKKFENMSEPQLQQEIEIREGDKYRCEWRTIEIIIDNDK